MGVVVIGRNEGARLVRCLQSVLHLACPVVYADSDSTDDSVLVAQSMGATTVKLSASRPMNASRGRKAGFDLLVNMHPDIEQVLFVDGDCELNEAFLPEALTIMSTRPEVAVVCGRRRERHPNASVYNRIADLEWETPLGETLSCGGDALIRVSAYLLAGGFDETVLAGEEPELCQRIRHLGFKVLRIDVDMSWHDMNMKHLLQWWGRGVRTGYGALDVRCRHGVKEFDRLLISAWLWVLAWPLISTSMVVSIAVSVHIAAACLLGLFFVLLLPLQMLRIAKAVHKRGLSNQDALAYGALMMVNKWACVSGQLKWLLKKN